MNNEDFLKGVVYIDKKLSNNKESESLIRFTTSDKNVIEKKYTDELYIFSIKGMKQISSIEKKADIIEVTYEDNSKVSFINNEKMYNNLNALKQNQEKVREIPKSTKTGKLKKFVLYVTAGAVLLTGAYGIKKGINYYNSSRPIKVIEQPVDKTPPSYNDETMVREPIDIHDDQARAEQVKKFVDEIKEKHNQHIELETAEDIISIINGRFEFDGMTIKETSARVSVSLNRINQILADNNNLDKEVVYLSDFVVSFPDMSQKIREFEELNRTISIKFMEENVAFAGRRGDLYEDFSPEYVSLVRKLMLNAYYAPRNISDIKEKSGAHLLKEKVISHAIATHMEPSYKVEKTDLYGQKGYIFGEHYEIKREDDKNDFYYPLNVQDKKLFAHQDIFEEIYDERNYSALVNIDGVKTEESLLLNPKATKMGVIAKNDTRYNQDANRFWIEVLREAPDFDVYLEMLDQMNEEKEEQSKTR